MIPNVAFTVLVESKPDEIGKSRFTLMWSKYGVTHAQCFYADIQATLGALIDDGNSVQSKLKERSANNGGRTWL